eukprot:COSAG06_NODE_8662_length_2103_cov_1.534930_1_plen_133_part_10
MTDLFLSSVDIIEAAIDKAAKLGYTQKLVMMGWSSGAYIYIISMKTTAQPYYYYYYYYYYYAFASMAYSIERLIRVVVGWNQVVPWPQLSSTTRTKRSLSRQPVRHGAILTNCITIAQILHLPLTRSGRRPQ